MKTKIAKDTKKYDIKQQPKFEYYNHCLEANHLENKIIDSE